MQFHNTLDDRFFVESITISETKCRTYQSGLTIDPNASSFPEFIKQYPVSYFGLGMTNREDAITRGCDGYFYWVSDLMPMDVLSLEFTDPLGPSKHRAGICSRLHNPAFRRNCHPLC